TSVHHDLPSFPTRRSSDLLLPDRLDLLLRVVPAVRAEKDPVFAARKAAELVLDQDPEWEALRADRGLVGVTGNEKNFPPALRNVLDVVTQCKVWMLPDLRPVQDRRGEEVETLLPLSAERLPHLVDSAFRRETEPSPAEKLLVVFPRKDLH